MELELIKKIDITANADVQYHRLMLLESGTVVAFYSDDDQECYFLDWYTTAGVEHMRIADFAYDVFDPPTLFQFPGYVGVYASSGNLLYLFSEEDKTQPIMISISNVDKTHQSDPRSPYENGPLCQSKVPPFGQMKVIPLRQAKLTP